MKVKNAVKNAVKATAGAARGVQKAVNQKVHDHAEYILKTTPEERRETRAAKLRILRLNISKMRPFSFVRPKGYAAN